MNLFFIDFETTGLNPYHNEPIEIAIKKFNNDQYYQSLITPTLNGINYKYLPKKIIEITGITDKDISEDSKTPNVVIYEIIKYIEDNSDEGPIYILAHNGYLFDFIFLRKMIKGYINGGIKTRDKSITIDLIKRFEYIDTLLVSRLLLRDERVNQSNLCKKYNIINNLEHRAYGDIIALEKIYIQLCTSLSYISKKNDKDYYINHPEELLQETTFINF